MAGKWICPSRTVCKAEEPEDCPHYTPHGIRALCLSSEHIGYTVNDTRCPDCLPIDKWSKGELLRWKVEGKV
jgi:hypothetical protein